MVCCCSTRKEASYHVMLSGGHDLQQHIRQTHHGPKVCCEDCEAPVCGECATYICSSDPMLPLAAFSNDLMSSYAPTELHSYNVSVMDIICASACIFYDLLHVGKHIVGIAHWMNKCLEICIAWPPEEMRRPFLCRGKIHYSSYTMDKLWKLLGKCITTSHGQRAHACRIYFAEDF